jgi:hypothetical protein
LPGFLPLENCSPLTLLHRKILPRSESTSQSLLINKSNGKPFINAEIFLYSIRTVFFGNLAELCTLDEVTEEKALLLMENWTSHLINDVIGFLTEGRVRVRTFARHTTQTRK